MSLLIKNVAVIEKDPEGGNTTAQVDVAISGDSIAEVGPNLDFEADEVIDGADKLAIPGLINAHLHSYDTFFKGAFDNMPLELWMLYSYPILGLARSSPRDIYLRTMLTAVEMIKTGTTAVQDDVAEHPYPTFEGVNALFEAYRDTGLRAQVTANLWDKPYYETIPSLAEQFPETIKRELDDRVPVGKRELMELCLRAIDTWQGKEGRLGYTLAPSGPQRVTDEFIVELDELSAERGVPLHCHVVETKVQAATGHEFYGETLVEHLHRLGVLSPRLTMIHTIWLTEGDIALMGDARVNMAHLPASNLKLGSGIAPIRKLLEAGVNCCLGCDDTSANDSQNMFDSLRLAALLHKVSGPDYARWISAEEAFDMATLGGARSILMEDELGALKPGMRADVALLDLKSVAFTPLNDPLRQVVFSERGESVDTTIVNGNVVMRGREILTFDEQEILDEAREAGERFLKDFRDNALPRARELEPYIRKMHYAYTARDVGADRYAPAAG